MALRGVCFGHQYDELIASVARHDVRAPAIRFQNVRNALQDEVAIQMPVKIIDEFEAVQIHEHQENERPARVERFHSAESASMKKR